MKEPQNHILLRETVYYVDDNLIKPKSNEIIVDGQKHRVRQKLIEVLSFMAANVGEVVSRDEVLENVWTAQPSSDEVLTQAISELRKLLRSSALDGEIIETIPKIGYRLQATIRVEAIQPRGFRSVAPAVQPSVDHLAFYDWTERLARQNRYLWMVVATISLALVISLIVLFRWGPYGEEIFIEMIDGVTITETRRGFLRPGEEDEGDETDEGENVDEGDDVDEDEDENESSNDRAGKVPGHLENVPAF